jgi:hypothetical protein
MTAAMLLAVDHILDGNCSLLPQDACASAQPQLQTAGLLNINVTVYDSKLQPALGVEHAAQCKRQSHGHIYVLGITDNVQVMSPVNTVNEIVSATPLSVQDVLGDDLFHPHLVR